MIDISTTATFDRLFDKLPKTIKRKVATKTDLFQVSIQACLVAPSWAGRLLLRRRVA